MSDVTPISVNPTPDDVQYLEDRIYEFNSSVTGVADGELLAFFVRERDRIVAGFAARPGEAPVSCVNSGSTSGQRLGRS
jgi:hypothetical protein